MITFKLTIRKEKIKSDKSWTVFIQVIYKRKRKFIPTSMSVEKKDLTTSYKIKNRRIIDRGNDLIREYQKRSDGLNLEFNDMDINQVVEYITKKSSNQLISFTDFANNWIEKSEIKGIRNYKSAITALKKHFGKDEIMFSEINTKTLKRFERELSDRPRAQSLYTNCIVKIFNDGREYYNDEENDIIKIKHTLKKYTAPKQNIAKQRALDLSEIVKIIKLPYKGEKTIKGDICRRDLAKDCFMLSFFLMGMNSADLYNANEYDGEYITYQRTKTKDRRSDNAEISVCVHPYIKELVENYRGNNKHVFNFYKRYSSASDLNKAINIGLKEIGAELGIENLQFYSARHSMATIAANDVGISIYIVNDMLNHIEPSMKITKLYIKKDYTAINEANYKLIEYVIDKLKSPLR